MSREVQQLFEHEQSAEQLARTLVLGDFGLYCIQSGLREAGTFEEDAGMGLYYYISKVVKAKRIGQMANL